jgi:hypothetical protein
MSQKAGVFFVCWATFDPCWGCLSSRMTSYHLFVLFILCSLCLCISVYIFYILCSVLFAIPWSHVYNLPWNNLPISRIQHIYIGACFRACCGLSTSPAAASSSMRTGTGRAWCVLIYIIVCLFCYFRFPYLSMYVSIYLSMYVSMYVSVCAWDHSWCACIYSNVWCMCVVCMTSSCNLIYTGILGSSKHELFFGTR